MEKEQKKSTTDARSILRRRIHRGGKERIVQLEQTRREMSLGMKIRAVREEAGFTQQQLAEQIGTQRSAISRIEDADYDGHSVGLLAKVAEALDMLLLIDFQPKHPPSRRDAKEN
jgi:DNA-binding XRE family transcriptional regulator